MVLQSGRAIYINIPRIFYLLLYFITTLYSFLFQIQAILHNHEKFFLNTKKRTCVIQVRFHNLLYCMGISAANWNQPFLYSNAYSACNWSKTHSTAGIP